MPSILDSQVARIVGFYPMIPRPSGVNLTCNAAAAAGQKNVNASGTTIQNGMDVFVGTHGELGEMCRVASGGGTANVVMSKNLKFDHAAAEPLVEMAYLNLGNPDEDGFTFTINGESISLKDALSRLSIALQYGYVDLELGWSFPLLNLDSFAYMLGMDRANLYGNGTLAAVSGGGATGPRGFSTNGIEAGTATGFCLKVVVQMTNGAFAAIEAYCLSFDPTGLTLTFGRGEPAKTPVKAYCANAAIDDTNSEWTPATTIATNAPGIGDAFSHMSNLYTMADTGVALSLTSQAAAGASTLSLSALTGIVAGTFLRVTGNSRTEYVQNNNTSGSDALIRHRLRNTMPNASVVQPQALTKVEGLTNPFVMSFSGSTRKVRGQQFRNTIAVQITDLEMSVSTSSAAFSRANVLSSLGMPSSVVADNVTPITGATGTAAPTTVLFEGNMGSGKKLYICAWSGVARIGGSMQFGVVPQTEVPLEWVPPVLSMWVHA
ncbi:MAG: hypothetical protein ACO1Q7_15900 [Gemmatimonas sp.]